MKRRRVEIASRIQHRDDVNLVKQDSSCFNCGNYREGYMYDSLGMLNALPVEPKVTIDFVEPADLSHASAEGPSATCDSLSIKDLFDFADPCRQFEFNVISTRASLCWDAISRNLQIAAELAGGHTFPAVSLRASSSFTVHPYVNGLHITISPAWWSRATSFTIVGLYHAGQLVCTPLLPAIVNIVRVNHAPSIAGPLRMSSKEGDLAGVISAIKDGCSTEESDDTVCTMTCDA